MLYAIYFTSTGVSSWSPEHPGDLEAALTKSDGYNVIKLGGVSLGLLQWIAWICIPIAAAKNLINVIQLFAACVDCANCDLAVRAEEREAVGGARARSRSPSASKSK
eukprot:SAG11_NODE_3744_length_2254_cov_1.617633_2_plen_107_part_00